MKRFHRKTRSGCSQCKRRRVKCDEGKPTCQNCRRNKLECSLPLLAARKPEDEPQRLQHRNTHLKRQASFALKADVGLSSLPIGLGNMELLHHYTSLACLSLGTERNMHVWQASIPSMAIEHDFLMHGLLAVSALHLLTLQPSRRSELVRRATSSESLALPSFRTFIAANHDDNVHAAFAFAGFLVPYLFALSGWLDAPVGRLPSHEDSRPHWFHMLRGLVELCARNWVQLAGGPFSSCLVRTVAPVVCSRNPDDVYLCRIYEILQPTDESTKMEIKDLDVCRAALDELRRVSALPYSPCRTLEATAVVYIWPGSISDDFVALVHQRRPQALIILAYYCVAMKKVDSCWYLKGVGDGMLGAIERELDGQWRSWIAWPLALSLT